MVFSLPALNLNTSGLFFVCMKCEICKSKISETFLEKPVGTYVKDTKGKKHTVCAECQKKFQSKKEMLEKF